MFLERYPVNSPIYKQMFFVDGNIANNASLLAETAKRTSALILDQNAQFGSIMSQYGKIEIFLGSRKNTGKSLYMNK